MLGDINGWHVTPEHVYSALSDASDGPVAEGSVGGGTGMVCHEFKGGIGTASRVIPAEDGGWTVGALVQANYGRRETLRVDGLPVGRVLTRERIPAPAPEDGDAGDDSIIAILATDAPLLPGQCERLAKRAAIGLARAGGGLDNGSGDIFLAFATGNTGVPRAGSAEIPLTLPVAALPAERMSPLFEAAADATEESILNALLTAETMTGRDGIAAHGLDARTLLPALEEARNLAAIRTETRGGGAA